MCSLVNFLPLFLAAGIDACGVRQPSCGSTVHARGRGKPAMNSSGYQIFANSFRQRAIFFKISHVVFESEQHSPRGRMTCTNPDSSSLVLGSGTSEHQRTDSEPQRVSRRSLVFTGIRCCSLSFYRAFRLFYFASCRHGIRTDSSHRETRYAAAERIAMITLVAQRRSPRWSFIASMSK